MPDNGDWQEAGRREIPIRLKSGELLLIRTLILKGKHWDEIDITAQHTPPDSTEAIDIGCCRGFLFNRTAALCEGWNFGRKGQPIPRHAQTFLKCAFDAVGAAKAAIIEAEDDDSEDSEDDRQVVTGRGKKGKGNRQLRGRTSKSTKRKRTSSKATQSTRGKDQSTANEKTPYLPSDSLRDRTPATNVECIGNHSFSVILHLMVDEKWRRQGIATRMCNLINRLAVNSLPSLKFVVVWPLGAAGDYELTPEMKAEGLGPDQVARIAQLNAERFYRYKAFVPLGTSRWYVRGLEDYRHMIQCDHQRTPEERAERARRFPDLASRLAMEMGDDEQPVQKRARQQTKAEVVEAANASWSMKAYPRAHLVYQGGSTPDLPHQSTQATSDQTMHQRFQEAEDSQEEWPDPQPPVKELQMPDMQAQGASPPAREFVSAYPNQPAISFSQNRDHALLQQQKHNMRSQPRDWPVTQRSNTSCSREPRSASQVQVGAHNHLRRSNLNVNHNMPSNESLALRTRDSDFDSRWGPSVYYPNNAFSDPEERRLASIGDEQTFEEFFAYWEEKHK